MANGTRGRGPLVADKRYTSSRGGEGGSGGKGGGPKKPAAPKPVRTPRMRSPAARPARQRGLVIGLLLAVWRVLWGIAWRATAIGALILGGVVWYFYAQLPEVADLIDGRARGSVTMLDREGNVFAWRGETFGGMITAESVAPDLHDAVVATEDQRFYQHFGISPRGIASAIRINLSEGRSAFEGNGGSTITQQTAKLLCLGVQWDPKIWKSESDYEKDCRKGGIWRKIKEVPFAMAMEVKYSKEEILTIYLNRAYLGAGARGFEAAAQRYFGKSARDVSTSEAAMLAGLLKAPSTFAPTASIDRARARAEVVIGLMEEQGYLTKAEADAARANPASLSTAANQRTGGYFADWVMETTPSYLARDTMEDVIIETTLDQTIQKKAEEALAFIFDDRQKKSLEAQAAIVVMTADGAVRAMVGGRNIPNAGDFNRATQALRQTGSTFKPFVYAAAMEAGYSPMDLVDDAPLCIYTAGSGDWCPKNYDKAFKGRITLTQALAESRNIPAVRVSEAVGRDRVKQIATDFGLAQNFADGPALALGVSESTLIDMTGAFAGILNGGSSVTPFGLSALKLKGMDEPLFGAGGGIGTRVISEKAARALTYMMTEVLNSGTGKRARLDDREAAGKTGTTQSARDAWFVGFTADYVVGVWIGYDDNRPLTGITGGGLPAEIWREVMVRINEGQPATPLMTEIPGSTYVPVDPSTTEGAIAAADVPYFDDPNAPTFTEVYVDPVTGENVPVYDGAPPQGAVMEGPVSGGGGLAGDLAGQLDQLLGGGN
ncbi:transglycosylase domain-containing protein [Tabrizicola sp.]|uniref:transglycosylase domain-containing protein n=1 Tax=Tabrizicola sp. TaxID=2005166 RepID=UPI0025E84157|nr:transglycosylase domain-containing protein [Tabrizicola sp.]MBY0349681.1 penicillin-binding protein [Tabrizicola sp.]